MKAILISIKPKWVAKILNGEKTIEIRKTMPKCDLPINVYIYCTKEDSLCRLKDYPKDRYVCEQEFKCNDFPKLDSGYDGKGKIVAKFTLNEITMPFLKDITKTSCLTVEELRNYLKGKPCYAWHIDNLVIFDKPKELSEFKQEWYDCGNNFHSKPLTKAPQSYMFVEVLV